ncbi:PREDICTED: uncharacterized protein LOC109240879 [Nicotiana attenuata]|nr:PREDICTED: uncharacterized protein LOC109240879 [Nicotiana attenuata]
MGQQQLQGTLHDRLKSLCKSGKYQIKQMFLKMIPDYCKVEWKGLMLHTSIHPRYRFILWLAVQKRLATIDRLLKFGIQVPAECIFFKNGSETFNHLFFECPVTSRLWAKLCHWLGHKRSIGDWECELEWINKKAKSRAGINSIACCVFAMTVAMIWRERNKGRFEDGKYDEYQICKEIILHIHVRGQNNKKWRALLQQLNWIS